jgi:hypothetical protein
MKLLIVLRNLFKRYHRFANRNTPGFNPIKNALTDQEADTLVNNVLKNAVEAKHQNNYLLQNM